MLQLLVKNGVCVNANRSFESDVAVLDGKVYRIGNNLDLQAEKIIDARGKYVLPGIIDTHVHLPWPSESFDSVDDFHSGTLSAAFGGVTTIIEYVIPDESSGIIPALDKEIGKAQDASYVDYSFHLIIRKVTAQTLAEMAEAAGRGITSFKIYMAYSGFQLEDEDILTLLKISSSLKTMICFHAEDGNLVNQAIRQLEQTNSTAIRNYPQAHPRIADVEATRRVIDYAKQLNGRIHIAHINTREGAQMVTEAHLAGLKVSGETCPHYLMFTEDVYKTGKPAAAYSILAPSLRGKDDQDKLWQALRSGGISTIATDHCPYNIEQKTKGGDDFRAVPGGAGGIETSLPLIYTYGVVSKKFDIEQMVALMSANPARLFNLYPRKGVIAEGSDADLVIYDPEGQSRIDTSELHSNSDHTLYQGMEVAGRVESTILRGNTIIENGRLVAREPSGKFILRPCYPD
jgi:dihydropyrimidinase